MSQSNLLLFEKLYCLKILNLHLCAYFLNHSHYLWVLSEPCFAFEIHDKKNFSNNSSFLS